MVSKYPFLLFLILFLAGEGLAYMGADIYVGLALSLAAVIISFAISLIARRRSSPLIPYRYQLLWIIPVYVGIGTILSSLSFSKVADPCDAMNATAAKGRIMSSYGTDSLKHKYAMAVDHILLPDKGWRDGKMILFLHSRSVELTPGQIITVSGPFKVFTDEPADGFSPPKGFRWLSRKSLMEISEDESAKVFFKRYSDKIHDILKGSSLSPSTVNLVSSLMIGRRHEMDRASRDEFRMAGLAHILAVSGLHTSIVASLLMMLLLPFATMKRGKVRPFLLILLLWLYILLTGMPISAIRAGIMCTFALTARVLERRNSSFNALCFAALIILYFDPSAIADVGFQLSFTIVAAILLYAGTLKRFDRRSHPIVYRMLESLIVIISATLTSWSMVAYYFGTFSIWFLPVNILSAPLLPIIICGGMIYFALLCFGIELTITTRLLDFVCELLYKIANIGADGGYGAISVSVTGAETVLWVSLALCVGFILNRWANRKKEVSGSL